MKLFNLRSVSFCNGRDLQLSHEPALSARSLNLKLFYSPSRREHSYRTSLALLRRSIVYVLLRYAISALSIFIVFFLNTFDSIADEKIKGVLEKATAATLSKMEELGEEKIGSSESFKKKLMVIQTLKSHVFNQIVPSARQFPENELDSLFEFQSYLYMINTTSMHPSECRQLHREFLRERLEAEWEYYLVLGLVKNLCPPPGITGGRTNKVYTKGHFGLPPRFLDTT